MRTMLTRHAIGCFLGCGSPPVNAKLEFYQASYTSFGLCFGRKPCVSKAVRDRSYDHEFSDEVYQTT